MKFLKGFEKTDRQTERERVGERETRRDREE
jgi:hypothetical protein